MTRAAFLSTNCIGHNGRSATRRLDSGVSTCAFGRTLRHFSIQRNQLEPGKEAFDKLEKKAEGLQKETAKYADGDLADLADGLKDDLNSVQNQIDKAKKDSKGRMFKGLATAGIVALIVGAVTFFMAPRKATAVMMPAFADTKEVKVGPVPEYIKADAFRGEMNGYVFKMGPEGLGYYLDAGVAAAPVSEGPLMMIRNSPTMAAAAGVGVVSVPLVGRYLLKKKQEQDLMSSSWSPPPASSSAPPFTPPPSTSQGAPEAAAPSASSPAAEAPASVPVGAQDPSTMKARELKQAILDLGGNPTGLVEKSELVALLRELQAAPRVMSTSPYKAADVDADFANFDPNTVDPNTMDSMMGNPMIQKLSKQMMEDPQAMKEMQDAMQSGKGMGSLMNNASFKKMTENLMKDPEIMQMMQNPSEVNKMMDQMKKMGVNPPNM